MLSWESLAGIVSYRRRPSHSPVWKNTDWSPLSLVCEEWPTERAATRVYCLAVGRQMTLESNNVDVKEPSMC